MDSQWFIGVQKLCRGFSGLRPQGASRFRLCQQLCSETFRKQAQETPPAPPASQYAEDRSAPTPWGGSEELVYKTSRSTTYRMPLLCRTNCFQEPQQSRTPRVHAKLEKYPWPSGNRSSSYKRTFLGIRVWVLGAPERSLKPQT